MSVADRFHGKMSVRLVLAPKPAKKSETNYLISIAGSMSSLSIVVKAKPMDENYMFTE